MLLIKRPVLLTALVVALLTEACNRRKDNQFLTNDSFPPVDSAMTVVDQYMFTKRYNEAEVLIDTLVNVSKRNHYRKGLIKLKHKKGYISGKNQELSRSLEYYNEAIRLAREYDYKLLTQSYLGIGVQYSNLNMSRQAYEYYLKALEIAEDLNDQELLRDCYLQVGLELYSQKQFSLAREYFTKSLNSFKRSDTSFTILFAIQQVEGNIGLTYLEEDKAEPALASLYRSLNTIKSIPAILRERQIVDNLYDSISLKIAEGVCYGNIARVYHKQGNTDRAIRLYNQNIEINSRPGYERNDAAKSAIYLAEIYSLRDREKEYLYYISLAEKLADSSILPSINAKVYLLKSRYAERKKNVGAAFYYLQKYNHVNDSMVSLTRKDDFLSMFANYENEKKENTFKLLKKENEIKNIYIIAICIIIVLLVIVAIVIGIALWNYRLSNARLLKMNLEMAKMNAELMQNKLMLEEANTKLTDLNIDKSHILRVVAHDLRNPIAGIKGIVELISTMDHGSNSAEINECIDHILQACNRASNIIIDLVEFSKDGQQRGDTRAEKTEIKAAIPVILDPLKARAEEKNIAFTTQLPDSSVFTRISKIKFERIVDNVVSNAIKFTPRGGQVSLNISENGNKVLIKVMDNGIGIPAELKNLIFDKFTKAGRKGTEGEKSIGLGMSIVKQFVDQHQGRIWIESEENKGTTVFIELEKAS